MSSGRLSYLSISKGWRSRLACPRCHASLELPDDMAEDDQHLVCTSCYARYPASQGIINYGVNNTFYDDHGFTSTGRNFSNGPVGKLGLYLARSHFLYDIAQAVAPGSAVIEVGPGGGSRFLAERYDMLGIELSSASVRYAASTYGSAVQATVASLPLANGCADALISSFLLEHLGSEMIEQSVSEMARVLKPNGQMLHFFDVDTDASFVGWAKRQPWYDAIFIDSKGHHGMRFLNEWQRLFADAGFAVEVRRLSCKSWLQDLSVWGALDQPQVTGIARRIGHAAAVVRKWINPGADLAINALNDLVDPLLPDDWAAKAIVLLRKSG